MSPNDKYKQYSAADIQKYLQGDLSAREMQALEAAALEDPFLADALEGMEKDRQLRGDAPFREDLAALKERLDQRIAKKNRAVVLPLYHSAWRATAAVIILLSLGAITYRYVLNGRSSTPSLASANAEKKTNPADRLSSATKSSEPKSSDTTVVMPSAGFIKPVPSPEVAPGSDRSQQVCVSDKKSAREKRASTSELSINRDADALPVNQAADASSAKAAAPPASAMYAADSTKLEALPAAASEAKLFKSNPGNYKLGVGSNQYIIGKVTDANNNPIPLITISFSGYKQAVRTDNNGLFRVQMLGSDSSTHIRIGSSGFESVELPAYTLAERGANGGVANTIRLQPQANGATDMTMNYRLKSNNQDKDITGYLQNGSSGIGVNPKGMVQLAAPASGWIAYKAWLEKNKQDRSIDSTKAGIEAISFKVNKKGKLSSFKIEQSLSPAHDSLLLRLIRHGSGWKSLAGNSGSATITLSY
jgi:cytoskeletal protein RodZ